MSQDEYTAKLEEILEQYSDGEAYAHQDEKVGLTKLEAITAIQQLNNEAMPNKTIGAPVGEYDTGGECGAYADGYNQLRQELRNILGVSNE